MAKQDMGPLGVIDLLTDKELRESMGHQFSHMVRDFYRGVDYLGFAGQGQGTSIVNVQGPASGYAWSLKLAAVQLSTSGALSVYPDERVNVAPLGTAISVANGGTNEAVITWTSNVVVVKDQRIITFLSNAATILSWRLMVKQVPTEMQAKLLWRLYLPRRSRRFTVRGVLTLSRSLLCET